jgi:hypothetical protein
LQNAFDLTSNVGQQGGRDSKLDSVERRSLRLKKKPSKNILGSMPMRLSLVSYSSIWNGRAGKSKKDKEKSKKQKRRRKIILLKRQDPQACGAAFAYGSLILTYLSVGI